VAKTAASHLEETLGAELTASDATVFVCVGRGDDPDVRYCLQRATRREPDSVSETGTSGEPPWQLPSTSRRYAVAYDRERWHVHADTPSGRPAEALATALAECGHTDVLTPATVPHDAALYLEGAGCSLASTDAHTRARARKTSAEREQIAATGATAKAALERGAALLADTTPNGHTLEIEGTALTADALRGAIDEAIVAAGAFPAGHTTIESTSERLRAGEPIVVAVSPRTADGYHSRLVRTFVVEGTGGEERRAHVGLTHAFRSTQAMLTADTHTVGAVEADLEAEIRAFGFGNPDAVVTNVSGIGLEPQEHPLEASEEIEPDSVLRLEAAARLEAGGWIRLADTLVASADGVEWLPSTPRSLEPAAWLE